MAKAKQTHDIKLLIGIDPLDARRRSLRIATIRQVPVYLHWSLLVGMLPIAALTGFDLVATGWYLFACLALVVVHELGHVAAALALNMQVFAVNLGFLGGHCIIQQTRGVRDTLLVYTAGLAAQAMLFALTILCIVLIGPPASAWTMSLFHTFVFVNVFVLMVSLVPLELAPGVWSDGGVLWKLFLHVVKGRPHPFPDLLAASVHLAQGVSPDSIPAMVPAGFTTGVEIMNDDTTPMEFVATVLAKYLYVERERAIELMLKVHGEGGLLYPVEGYAAAQAFARLIEADARAAGHQLVCRAVDIRAGAVPAAGDGAA